MPSTQICQPCCSTPQSVDIPGPIGADGFDGTNGTDGVNAYTVTTSSLPLPNPPTGFVIPQPNNDISVNVANTSWMVVGQVVIIAGPANFRVMSITSPTVVVLRFLENPGDLPAGSVIPVGAGVSPSAFGISAFTFTTTNFTIPNIGDPPVSVPVINSEWVTAGASVFINGDYFTVASDPTSTTSMSLSYSNVTSNVHAGNTVLSGATIISGNHSGENAYTLVIAPTVATPTPVGTNVTVNVANSDWMVPGENVIIGGSWGSATFQVVGTPPTSTTALLKFLGYPNDVASGITMTAGSRVSATAVLATNQTETVYAATGTPYVLTATPTLMTIGATALQITLGGPGTYLLFADVQYSEQNWDGTTVSPPPTIVTALYTSSVAIPNSTTSWISSRDSSPGQPNITAQYCKIPTIVYTTTGTGDVIQLWGSYNGSLTGTMAMAAVEANIVAVKLAP